MDLLTSRGLGVFFDATHFQNEIAAVVIAALLFSQIKNKKYKIVYLSAIYFYVGYYALSVVNKSGMMLYHYIMPLFPLIILIFASFITSKYKQIFFIFLIFVYWTNLTYVNYYISQSQDFIGKNQNSWQFLSQMAQKVYQGNEKELGYFVYMPDALAYQPKYAMLYASKQAKQKSFYFQKMPVTYLVMAPPPPNKKGMESSWWVVNQVKITSKPMETFSFPNGYKIEKYLLSEEERKVPFDPTIDTGLHFR